MFWMRNKENGFPIHTLIWRPEKVSHQPLKFDLLSSVVTLKIRARSPKPNQVLNMLQQQVQIVVSEYEKYFLERTNLDCQGLIS